MWNHKNKWIFIASLWVAVGVTPSCSKIDDFGDLNSNPNESQSPFTAGLLTQTLSGIGNNYAWDQGGISTASGLYCQYFAETQYTEASRYAKTTASWDGYYANALKDLQTIIDYNSNPATAVVAAESGPNENQIAVARILKAYIFWFLTDTWGDIPYKDIFKVENNGIVAYTLQQEIYTDLLKELDEAVKQLKTPANNANVVKGDILFPTTSAASQATSWKKFANSVRAIMALRLSKVDPATGKQQFLAALDPAMGGVLANEDVVTMNYPGGNFPSPVYNYYNITSRRDYAVTDVLVDYLYDNFDDRVYAYATSTTGFPYGLTRDNAIDFSNAHSNWARVLGGGYTKTFNAETSPVFILGAAEVYLARAEAAFLGWTSENVQDMYYSGIRAGWQQWDVYDAGFYNDYISESEIALTGNATEDYRKIATQEWIAHYPKGWMGWADWRRTGYPQLTPAPGRSQIPVRYAYGVNEFNLNPANANAGAAKYTGPDGANSQYAPVWWDK